MNAALAKRWKVYHNFICLIIVITGMTGCTVTEPSLNLKKELAAYAEDVFLHQNQVTQQLMMLFDEQISAAEESRISQLELEMYDACHLLNQFAINESEGKKMSVFFRTRLKNSLRHCEDKVIVLESSLEKFLQETK